MTDVKADCIIYKKLRCPECEHEFWLYIKGTSGETDSIFCDSCDLEIVHAKHMHFKVFLKMAD